MKIPPHLAESEYATNYDYQEQLKKQRQALDSDLGFTYAERKPRRRKPSGRRK